MLIKTERVLSDLELAKSLGIEVGDIHYYVWMSIAKHVQEAILDKLQAVAGAISASEPVRMGYDEIAVGVCENAEDGELGIIYLQLPEGAGKVFNESCGDIFPEGSEAPKERTKACIYFKSKESVQQSIQVLEEIKQLYEEREGGESLQVEWYSSSDGSYLFSSDFTHDVKLTVDGDFEDEQQRIAYTKELVVKLNRPLKNIKKENNGRGQ